MGYSSEIEINYTSPDKGKFTIQPFTSDGTVSPTSSVLETSSIEAHTSLLLFGKGHPNYGDRIQENFVHIMENFAGTNAPIKPTTGQLWYDTSISRLKVYRTQTDGDVVVRHWDVIDRIQAQEENPNTEEYDLTVGQLWVDTTNLQDDEKDIELKVYDGASFVNVSGNYLSKYGGTATGEYSIDGDVNVIGPGVLRLSNVGVQNAPVTSITSNNHLTTKEYVDMEVATNRSLITSNDDELAGLQSNKVSKGGADSDRTMANHLLFPENIFPRILTTITDANHTDLAIAVNKEYVDTKIQDVYSSPRFAIEDGSGLSPDGTTLTLNRGEGNTPIIITGFTSNAHQHDANEVSFDNSISNLPRGTATGDMYVQEAIDNLASRKFNSAGGSVFGDTTFNADLTVQGALITNGGTPSLPQEAVNLQYIQNRVLGNESRLVKLISVVPTWWSHNRREGDQGGEYNINDIMSVPNFQLMGLSTVSPVKVRVNNVEKYEDIYPQMSVFVNVADMTQTFPSSPLDPNFGFQVEFGELEWFGDPGNEQLGVKAGTKTTIDINISAGDITDWRSLEVEINRQLIDRVDTTQSPQSTVHQHPNPVYCRISNMEMHFLRWDIYDSELKYVRVNPNNRGGGQTRLFEDVLGGEPVYREMIYGRKRDYYCGDIGMSVASTPNEQPVDPNNPDEYVDNLDYTGGALLTESNGAAIIQLAGQPTSSIYLHTYPGANSIIDIEVDAYFDRHTTVSKPGEPGSHVNPEDT